MKDDELDFGSFIGGCVCGILIGITCMFLIIVFSDLCTPNFFHKQAVNHKAGIWVVDKSGNVEFKWNDQLPDKKE